MTAEEETPETPVEEPEGTSRVAGGCVLVIGVGIAGGVVVAVPELGYTVAGALAVIAVGRARAWTAKRRDEADEQAEEDAVDITAALHGLSPAGAQNVRLTQLAEATDLPDTKAVRALLDEAGIPVKAGVRADGKNGPGVHHGDIPRSCDAPSEGCWCRSGANTNTNDGAGPEKGFRVEHTGHAGITVYDLSETHQRRHTAKT